MAALINFKGTICCTNMDNHAKPAKAYDTAPLELELENLSRLLRSAYPMDSSSAAASASAADALHAGLAAMGAGSGLPAAPLHAVARLMSSIVDPVTFTLLTTPFLLQLETEIHRVRRGKSELALVCFDLRDGEELAEQHGLCIGPLSGQALVHALKDGTLPCDCIGRVHTGQHALILPGAGAFKAQALTEKMLSCCACQRITTEHGSFTPHFAAGIACASGAEAQVSTLIEEALRALDSACQNGACCSVYRATGPASNLYQTLVHSNEKRFLFSGGK